MGSCNDRMDIPMSEPITPTAETAGFERRIMMETVILQDVVISQKAADKLVNTGWKYFRDARTDEWVFDRSVWVDESTLDIFEHRDKRMPEVIIRIVADSIFHFRTLDFCWRDKAHIDPHSPVGEILSQYTMLLIDEVGYHTRDYFLAQMERFAEAPGGIMAHSTHVRGIGTYENGVEKPRVRVTLATSIPEAECRSINLGYRDPDSINPGDWKDKEDEGLLLVPDAGEVLYRLKADNPVPKPWHPS